MHRFDGVADEVHENLTDFPRKTRELRRVFSFEFNLHASGLEFAPEQRQYGLHDVHHICRDRSPMLAMKLQPLGCDFARPHKLLLSLPEVGPGLLETR
jgi:hypothetical protein